MIQLKYNRANAWGDKNEMVIEGDIVTLDKKEIEELMVFLIRNYARIEKRGYLEGGQVTILDFRESIT